MSDEYSYRDARLSIWQAAAGEVQGKRNRPVKGALGGSVGGSAGRALTASSPKLKAPNPLMNPVHMVAHTIQSAGKPFKFLVDEVKKGILDLKAKFNPLEDCANAAAHFLWAELEGDEKNSNIYAGELKKSVCDAVGWAECLTTYFEYKLLLEKPMYRPNENVVVDIPQNTKVAILGDWGTGDDVAANLLRQVAALHPDILLHVGDIYYAGTENEARKNFLGISRSVLGNIPLYSLCGNHDMYSGGEGYYWLLDQIGQKSSYFCLQNADWIFLAMDTGFHDNNPFTVATNMTQLVEQPGWSEADWHLKQIAQAGSRKVVLLSHHQVFSPFSSVGSVDGTPYAYNPNLYKTFAAVLPKVEWWFWGHEHTLGVYAPYMGLKRGRCVGASAVPVFADQQSYATASGLATLNGTSMPAWDTNAVLGSVDNMYNNCFAMMSVNGPSATVEYYEVPLLGKSRRFNVTDTV
jgi:hypothetical protein